MLEAVCIVQFYEVFVVGCEDRSGALRFVPLMFALFFVTPLHSYVYFDWLMDLSWVCVLRHLLNLSIHSVALLVAFLLFSPNEMEDEKALNGKTCMNVSAFRACI